MEKEEERTNFNSVKDQTDSQKKKRRRFFLPYSLRFAIIWTLFFIIIGIVLQSIKADKLILQDFFVENFIQWFKDFGTFTDPATYPDINSILLAIIGKWYYFFYTGGLLSLIWAILSWIFHSRAIDKEEEYSQQRTQKEDNKVEEKNQLETQKKIQDSIKSKVEAENLPTIVISEKVKTFPNQLEQINNSSPLLENKISEWLDAGLLLLSEGNLAEAELVYDQISRQYNALDNRDPLTYKRILDFYYELSMEKEKK